MSLMVWNLLKIRCGNDKDNDNEKEPIISGSLKSKGLGKYVWRRCMTLR